MIASTQDIKKVILEKINKMTGNVSDPTSVFNNLPYRTRGDFLRKWGLEIRNTNMGFDQVNYNDEFLDLYIDSGGKGAFNQNEYDKIIEEFDSATTGCNYGAVKFSEMYADRELKNIKKRADWKYFLLSKLNDYKLSRCINKTKDIDNVIKNFQNEYFSNITDEEFPINIIPNSGNTCFIDSILVAILANPTKLLRKKLNEFYISDDVDNNLQHNLMSVDLFIDKSNNDQPNVKNLAKALDEKYVDGGMNDPNEFLKPLFNKINLGIDFTETHKKKIDVNLLITTYKSVKNYNKLSAGHEIIKPNSTAKTIVNNIFKNIFYNKKDISSEVFENVYGLVKSNTKFNNLNTRIVENFKIVTYTEGSTMNNKYIPYITTTTATIFPTNAPLYIHTQPSSIDNTKPLILSEYVKNNDINLYELRSIVVYVSTIHYVCFFKDKNNIWWLYDDFSPKLQKFKDFKEVLSYSYNPLENCVLLCYECLMVESFAVDSTPNTAHVLASGGFGMVVADGNIAKKLMYSKTTCDAAAIEYHNINTLYNAFERARNSSQNNQVLAALHILKPLVPRGFLKKPFEFIIGTNVERFSCQLLTDRIPGLSTLQLPHDNIVAAVRQYFPEILVMPVFEFQSRLSLRNPNEYPDPERNFPRYYISNMDEVGKIYPTIDFLHEFPYAMGVLLAVFVFEAKLSMMDVEILLGSIMNIYIVDLGMCKDISEIVDSGDLHELSAILTDISGPFYTKNSFPLPSNEPQYGSFIRGFWEAGMDMGVSTEFLQMFIEQLQHDLT